MNLSRLRKLKPAPVFTFSFITCTVFAMISSGSMCVLLLENCCEVAVCFATSVNCLYL